MENLKKFFEWTKKLPFWIRTILYLMISAIALIASLSLSACGQTVRVTVKDTPNGVTISTSQHKQDSSGTNINITPNIHLQKP